MHICGAAGCRCNILLRTGRRAPQWAPWSLHFIRNFRYLTDNLIFSIIAISHLFVFETLRSRPRIMCG